MHDLHNPNRRIHRKFAKLEHVPTLNRQPHNAPLNRTLCPILCDQLVNEIMIYGVGGRMVAMLSSQTPILADVKDTIKPQISAQKNLPVCRRSCECVVSNETQKHVNKATK